MKYLVVAALLMLACVLVWGQHSNPPSYFPSKETNSRSVSSCTENSQCSNVPATKECVAPPKNTGGCTCAPPRIDWNGKYQFHHRGKLSYQYLCQIGSKIYGQYDGAGLIWGDICGNTVTGRYYEAGGYYGNFMWTSLDGGQSATGSSYWGDFANTNTQAPANSWDIYKVSSVQPSHADCMFSPNPPVSLNGILQGDSFYGQQYLVDNVFFQSYIGINGSELGDSGTQIGVTPDGFRYVGSIDDYNYAVNPPQFSNYLTVGYIDDEGNNVENDWAIDYAVGPYYTDGVFEATYSIPFISSHSCYEVARGLTPYFQERVACYYILNGTNCVWPCQRLLQL